LDDLFIFFLSLFFSLYIYDQSKNVKNKNKKSQQKKFVTLNSPEKKKEKKKGKKNQIPSNGRFVVLEF
jgi:hypothetical protein